MNPAPGHCNALSILGVAYTSIGCVTAYGALDWSWRSVSTRIRLRRLGHALPVRKGREYSTRPLCCSTFS